MNVAKKDWRERFDEIFGEVSKKDAELVDMLEPCPHMPCSGAVKDFIAAEIAAAEDRVHAQYKPLVEALMPSSKYSVSALLRAHGYEFEASRIDAALKALEEKPR